MRDMLLLFPTAYPLDQASTFLQHCGLHVTGTDAYLPGIAHRFPWGVASPHTEVPVLFAESALTPEEHAALQSHQSLFWLRPRVEDPRQLGWVLKAIRALLEHTPGFYAQHCGLAVLAREWREAHDTENELILEGLLNLGWEKGILRTLGMEALGGLPDLAVACSENQVEEYSEVLEDLAHALFVDGLTVQGGDLVDTPMGAFRLRKDTSSPFAKGDVLRNQSGTYLLKPEQRD